MSLFSRFTLFFFGILIGVIVLFFSFSFRKSPLSFNYLPNSRVISYIANNKLDISEKSHCKMICYNLDTMSIGHYISNSKVDFKKSKIRETEIKMYHLSFTDFTFLIVKRSDSLILQDVIHESTICLDCN